MRGNIPSFARQVFPKPFEHVKGRCLRVASLSQAISRMLLANWLCNRTSLPKSS